MSVRSSEATETIDECNRVRWAAVADLEEPDSAVAASEVSDRPEPSVTIRHRH